MSRSLTLIAQMMQSSLRRLDILMEALKSLNEEFDLLRFWVAWGKTNIEAFIDLLMLLYCLYLTVLKILKSQRESHLPWQ